MDGSDGLPNTNADLSDKDNFFDWTSKDGKKKEEKKQIKKLKTFKKDEIKEALKYMWDLSKSGTKDAKEVVGYITKNTDGELLINVFDPAGNTATTSENQTWDPAETGEELLAQIHTHPDYLNESGKVEGSEWLSDEADQAWVRKYKLPMFIVSRGGEMIRSASGFKKEDDRFSPEETAMFKKPEILSARINEPRKYLVGVHK